MFRQIKSFFRRGWLIKVPAAEVSYAILLKKLECNEPFAFSRWGDGEWEAVLEKRNERQANCDGHNYFASMNKALQEILKSNPPYALGMQNFAYGRLLGRHIDSFLKKNKIFREWLNADALHHASIKGTIHSFFDLLANRRLLLVGPTHLRKLNILNFTFCEVPGKNCWLERERVMQEIRQTITSERPEVILLCAGMTSNWFVDELYRDFPGIILDIGSLLDPYAGVNSRKYHKTLNKVDS